MQKDAQDRSLWSKLREKTNISGKLLESVNSEFAETMDKLRTTDATIREQASSLKNFVKASKTLIARRDYLASATNVSAFHEKCRYISAELEDVIKGVDLKHYKFLLDQFDDEQKEQLFNYDPNHPVKRKAASSKITLKKQADGWFSNNDPIADMANDLASTRSKAMKALEKRFSISFLKNLKTTTSAMVSRTENFYQFLVAVFNKLSMALAKRNIDQYVDAAKVFIRKFSEYHAQYVDFYKTSISPLKTHYQQITENAKLAEQEKLKQEEAAKQEQGNNPVAQENAAAPMAGAGDHSSEEDEDAFSLEQDKKITASDFINKIVKIASPRELMMEILAFSEKMEEIDAGTSLKLLAVAEGIAEDYKKAGIFDSFKGKKDQAKTEKEEELPFK